MNCSKRFAGFVPSSRSAHPYRSACLDESAAKALVEAGCVTCHHNLETARSFFPQICTTHDYEDDVATIRIAKAAGMKVCSGGIFGLGEALEQRIEMGLTLRELGVDAVPLNFLSPIAGTPLEGNSELTPLDCPADYLSLPLPAAEQEDYRLWRAGTQPA